MGLQTDPFIMTVFGANFSEETVVNLRDVNNPIPFQAQRRIVDSTRMEATIPVSFGGRVGSFQLWASNGEGLDSRIVNILVIVAPRVEESRLVLTGYAHTTWYKLGIA